ncbi:DMT family transporter [Hydrogenibacillus schlegelii]|uniref:EamA domain-containing protein n=1 Tax=Hydrogenibacillus schlegelii TaxID=1484 RepID=A0A132MI71_HYDSH|nr:DMT family transporter [Hydrogenibacillus schlegelii]KWW97121.1 hypothetical protein TR75_10320 [Hydrogenibacillus schlegelii]OAR03851.1 hypothetical protein SA87_03165 [Hydrogenibacillus schlegelii]
MRMGALAVLLAASMYGTLAPAVKRAYEAGLSFAEVTFGQLFWAAVLLTVVRVGRRLLFDRRPSFSRRPFVARRGVREEGKKATPFRPAEEPADEGGRGRAIAGLAALGVAGLAGVSLAYYGALRTLPAQVALVLLFQFVWMGIVLERLLFGVRITAGRALAVVLIFVGDALALRVWAIDWSAIDLRGMALGLLAAGSYTTFLLGTARIRAPYDVVDRSLVMVVTGALVVSAFFRLTEPSASLLAPPSAFGLVLWLALFGQVLPPLLFNWGAPRIGGAATTLLSSAELPVGMITAAVVLGEPLGGVELAGVALIVAGVALVAYGGTAGGGKPAERALG